ncbi:hypothetical protein B296_00050971 [Ensete ventricosum]|uniref:Uncharacterized protein n=1 Tax=Ensete ventricosum TaxID=4639 RepID=A0A426XPC4_ENSVE|nr:hypothetical protein B296_00050971 [Ensete ventricosum]
MARGWRWQCQAEEELGMVRWRQKGGNDNSNRGGGDDKGRTTTPLWRSKATTRSSGGRWQHRLMRMRLRIAKEEEGSGRVSEDYARQTMGKGNDVQSREINDGEWRDAIDWRNVDGVGNYDIRLEGAIVV